MLSSFLARLIPPLFILPLAVTKRAIFLNVLEYTAILWYILF